MPRRTAPRAALAALAAALAAGCGGSPPLGGTVSRAGAPVPHGVVQVVPDREKGNTGPTVTLKLVAGRFTTVGAASDAGAVTPGPQVVTLFVPGEPRPGVPEGETPTAEYTIPIDVPPDGKTDLTFDVAQLKPAGKESKSGGH